MKYFAYVDCVKLAYFKFILRKITNGTWNIIFQPHICSMHPKKDDVDLKIDK